MSDSEFNFDRWEQLVLRTTGAACNRKIFDSLYAAYSEPHRAYHNCRHISDCLHALDESDRDGVNLNEVELALWFHDVVYDTRAGDNEAKSAQWAKDSLEELNCRPESVTRVVQNIIATSHQSDPVAPNEQLTVDIDLSILGQPQARYDEFEASIRLEYEWVPTDVFNATRRTILEGFLQRERIYSTEEFASRYEARARANLVRAINNLGD